MQQPTVMAFRKRLKKRGYTKISIKRIKKTGNFMVTAVEPLAGVVVSREYSLVEMYNTFRF